MGRLSGAKMTTEEFAEYCTELKVHLDALGRGETYMLDLLEKVANEVVSLGDAVESPSYEISPDKNISELYTSWAD